MTAPSSSPPASVGDLMLPAKALVAEQTKMSPEVVVDSVRRWALSLHNSPRHSATARDSPRHSATARDESCAIMLPPLRPLKEYKPATACMPSPVSRRKCLFAEFGDDFVRRTQASQLTSHLTSPLGFVDNVAHALTLPRDISSSPRNSPQTARSTRFASRGDRVGDQGGSRPNAPASQQRRPPPITRMMTVVRPPDRPPVRGKDPMAGSLFGRDAKLDDVSEKQGLYHSKLRTAR
eukprot:TRINITY_DN6915_c0_g1_i1.p1 TRINITY_DN6915_c0_g1~~TRINITY_DN6915_c0_g1_i1.p1  ORF type:complete len:236 (-),score=18.87 TRINITY_DN6915_c0_g1_i1:349-1056(-)